MNSKYSKRNVTTGMFITLISFNCLAQNFSLDMEAVSDSNNEYWAKLNFSPLDESPNGGKNRSHPITIGLNITLLENDWLISDQNSNSSLNEEEKFVKEVFLAYQNLTSAEDFKHVADESWYQLKKDAYKSNPNAITQEAAAHRRFSDIRPVCMARYGQYFLFMSYLKSANGAFEDLPIVMVASRMEQSYLQTAALTKDTTIAYIITGKIQQELVRELSNFNETK